MIEIRDCKRRLACKGDAETGLVEAMYKGQVTRTHLSVGEVFTIERDGIVTEVKRINRSAFQVNSQIKIAG